MKRLKDESGQALIITALCMTCLFGFAALATDVGLMFREKRLLQIAADSAAVAGALEAASAVAGLAVPQAVVKDAARAAPEPAVPVAGVAPDRAHRLDDAPEHRRGHVVGPASALDHALRPGPRASAKLFRRRAALKPPASRNAVSEVPASRRHFLFSPRGVMMRALREAHHLYRRY